MGEVSGGRRVTGDWRLLIASFFAALVLGGTSWGQVRISQIYGAGGNSGAAYKYDYVEIYNAGTNTVSLSGYSIQFASSTGTSWSVINLSGNIQAKAYFLIASTAGTTGASIPTADVTGALSLAAAAGKVALVSNTTALSGGNPVGGANVVDLVGFGTGTTGYEGTGPATAPSTTNATFRKNNGETDSNDNAADFTAAAANPRNSATAGNPSIATSAISLNQFSAIAGSASDPQSFTVLGFGLSTSISVTAPAGFEISSDGATYSSSLTLPAAGGTVSVRIPATATSGSSPSGNITLASSPALSRNVAVSGAVTAANSPSVTASPTTLTGFSTYAGSVSTAQTITVSGTNLTASVSVTAAAGYEVSSDNTTFSPSVSLAQTGGTLTNTPVYVRVAGTASAGALSGTAVSVSSTGSPILSVSGSGSVLTPSLSLTLSPNPLNEGASSTGTISIPQARIADLAVTVGSATTNSVTVPTSVTIPSGSTSVTFQATAANNSSSYAESSSLISVSATGVTGTSATLTVNNSTPAPITPIALGGSGLSNSYIQDFNGLGINAVSKVIPGSNGVIVSLGAVTSSNLNGWYAAKNSGTGNTATDISVNTNSSSGGLYNFGPLGGSERALGSIGAGSVAVTYGALFTNSSAGTITNVRISVKGEFWRSSTSVTNVLTNGYGKVDGTTITTGNFLTATTGVGTVAALNIVGPAPVATNGPIDGTQTINQTNLTSVSLPLVLLAGETGFIRWQDVDDNPGSDAGLAIDDFVLTYDVDTTPQFTSFSPGSAQAGSLVTIFGANFTTNTTVSFNGIQATAVTWVNPSQLLVTVPSGATTGPISITQGGATLTSGQVLLVGTFQASVGSFGSTTIGGTVTKPVVASGNGLPGTSLTLTLSGANSSEFQVASANLDAGFTSGYGASSDIPVTDGAVDSSSADYFSIQFTPASTGAKTAVATLSSGGVIVGQLTLTGTANGLLQPRFLYGYGQNTRVVLGWTNSANFTNLVLLGQEGSSPGNPGATESLNGSSNFPSANLASNGASVLFAGDYNTTNLTVTGLTNNRFYYFTLFNREGTNVSSGSTYRLMPYADLSNPITQWNFNNSDLTPNVGSGTASAVGGVTAAFVNGLSGSSDRSGTNKAASIKGSYNTFTGLQFAASTVGKQGVKVYWDIGASGSASKYTKFQYTLDVTAATPSWVDYSPSTNDSPGVAPQGGLYALDQADVALLQRSADLSGVSGVENNPKFGFRVITANGPGINVIVRADGTTAAYSTAGTVKYDMVTVTGVDGNFNSTPTDISLSAASIAENNEVNVNVGTFSTMDPDSGDTFAYSLVAGTGDTDNASFNISGNSLRAGVVFDYETKSSYSIRVRTTDSAGASLDRQFTITVTDVNETPTDITAPVITLTGSETMTVAWGSSYSDAGATATDNVDTSVTVNSSGSVNPAVPGTYTITYTASDAANNAAMPVTRTVTVSAPSNTLGADGLSGLLRYAFGANGPNDSVTKPTASVSGGNLVLTAIVRTNQTNPSLMVVGQWVTNVSQFTNTSVVTSNTISGSTNGVSQTNVPAGCERRAFTVPQGSDGKKFLRLKVEM